MFARHGEGVSGRDLNNVRAYATTFFESGAPFFCAKLCNLGVKEHTRTPTNILQTPKACTPYPGEPHPPQQRLPAKILGTLGCRTTNEHPLQPCESCWRIRRGKHTRALFLSLLCSYQIWSFFFFFPSGLVDRWMGTYVSTCYASSWPFVSLLWLWISKVNTFRLLLHLFYCFWKFTTLLLCIWCGSMFFVSYVMFAFCFLFAVGVAFFALLSSLLCMSL